MKPSSRPAIGKGISPEISVCQSEALPAVVRKPAPHVGDVPLIVAVIGVKAKKRFTTFFTDAIRNPNTREAYFRAAFQFFEWCEKHHLALESIESFHVSAYIEELLKEKSRPTVKQHLAALRMMFDWLVVGQVVPSNPAHAVRGPKHVVREGLTPILDTDEMKELLAAIDTRSVVGLRDRALISMMAATFGRVDAAVGMNVTDYYPEGKHWKVRLSEKNDKVITMPAQHKLEKYLDEYIAAVGGVDAFPFETITDDWDPTKTKKTKKKPLFLTTRGRSAVLTDRRMTRIDAWKMVKRRAQKAGVNLAICNHSFRGAGITNYLENGGDLLEAQRMAGHADPRTTRLYDRRQQEITRGEVERITLLG